MFIQAAFGGLVWTVYVIPEEWGITPQWTVGQLQPGQVWGQLDSEGPFRPVTPIS